MITGQDGDLADTTSTTLKTELLKSPEGQCQVTHDGKVTLITFFLFLQKKKYKKTLSSAKEISVTYTGQHLKSNEKSHSPGHTAGTLQPKLWETYKGM